MIAEPLLVAIVLFIAVAVRIAWTGLLVRWPR
jgi:hypothetical protein